MDSVLFATAKMYLRQWAAQIVPTVRRRSALASRQIADEQGEDDNARVQGKERELCAVMTSQEEACRRRGGEQAPCRGGSQEETCRRGGRGSKSEGRR